MTEVDSDTLVEIQEDFPIDGFGYSSNIGELERGQVRANQSLYVLLNEMGFSEQVIWQVSNELKQRLFSIFKTKIKYTIDIESTITYDSCILCTILILMESNVRYIKIDLSDGIVVQASAKPIEIRYRQVEGIIESSLYESLVSQGHSAGVGMELNEIFAWQIDFSPVSRR